MIVLWRNILMKKHVVRFSLSCPLTTCFSDEREKVCNSFLVDKSAFCIKTGGTGGQCHGDRVAAVQVTAPRSFLFHSSVRFSHKSLHNSPPHTHKRETRPPLAPARKESVTVIFF